MIEDLRNGWNDMMSRTAKISYCFFAVNASNVPF